MILVRFTEPPFPFLRTHINLPKINNIITHLVPLQTRLHAPPFPLHLHRRLPSHLQRKHLSRRPRCIFLPPLASLSAGRESLPFERGCTAVKDEDGFDAEEEEFADAAEEAYDVGIA
jgi:hypothetical protein